MNDQPSLPEEEPKPFEPVWKPRRESEVVGSLWANAAIGFVIAVATGFSTVALVANLPMRSSVPFVVAALVALVVVLAFVSLKTRRTGLVGGALLAIGVCMLCPFVGLFVICGGIRL